MAQVPYSPVPDIAPSVPGPARVSIQAEPAAFGAATAAATRQLGGQAEQSANELAQTTLYVKQLENDTWAKNDFVNQSAKIGEIENNLYSLKGQEAVNAAPKAAQQIQQIYQNAIAGAPNPQAGRMLGDQLSRRIAYSLVDIGRHSGQQRLAAAGDASASTVAVGMDLVSKSPYNDDLFQDYVRDGGVIDQEASTLERLGFGKAAANSIKLKNQFWEARFEALYGKPDQAQALYDQNEKDISPAAKANIIRQIKSSESAVKFNASYSAALSKAQGEADVSEISSRNRIINPATGQAGYGPNAIKELTDYARQNPSADKEVEERLKWIRQANEDAAKGAVIQTKPETLSRLTGNMFGPNPTSERDLAIEENNRSLGPNDRQWLQNVIKLRDGADKEAMNYPAFKIANEWAKSAIQGTGAVREMNASNYAAFQYEFLTRYLQATQDKTLKPNDLDIRNPDGMLRQIADKFVPGIGQTIRANGGVAAPAPTPGVSASPPTALPPLKERVKGQSYMTGKGLMEWTGTGWVPPTKPASM